MAIMMSFERLTMTANIIASFAKLEINWKLQSTSISVPGLSSNRKTGMESKDKMRTQPKKDRMMSKKKTDKKTLPVSTQE